MKQLTLLRSGRSGLAIAYSVIFWYHNNQSSRRFLVKVILYSSSLFIAKMKKQRQLLELKGQ